MVFLEQFSGDEKELLVTLPYRAGLWVSRADETGGQEADDRELVTLRHIIAQKSEGTFESAFVHEVMVEICSRKKDWPSWSKNVDSVMEDCRKVTGLISSKLSDRDETAYKENLMHIGVEVAKAFREFGENEALPIRLWTFFKIRLDALIGFFKGEKYESEALLSISYDEDMALAELAKALRSGVDDEAEDMQIPAA